MMIECLVRREGPTMMTIGDSKFPYMFMPIPGAKPGEQVTSVANIMSAEHIAYFMRGKGFREYDAERSQRDLEVQRLKEKRNHLFEGYAIEKFSTGGQDRGYVVADRRDPRKVLYAGSNKPFTDVLGDLVPFKSEFEAWQFLKAEVDVAPEPEEAPPAPSLSALEAENAQLRERLARLEANAKPVETEKGKGGKTKKGEPPIPEVSEVLRQITGE